jgi:hypothetical protein
MLRLWPLLFVIPILIVGIWLEWERRAALRELFEVIRSRKRTYVLNNEGTAYVLKEGNDGEGNS